MYGRLPAVDAFRITSLIKGDVRISVNMDRSNDEFVLMCSDEGLQPKLIIQKIVLYFKKIQLTPSYRQAMFSEINRKPQEIFFKKLRIVKKTFSAGLHELSCENVLGAGMLPTRLFTFLISESRSSGDYKQNPLYFFHHHVTSAFLNIGGYLYPNQPYVTDFSSENSIYYSAYMGLRSVLGGETRDFYISPFEYQQHFTVMAFDITPDMESFDQDHLSLQKQGSIQVNYKLAKALEVPTNLFVVAEYDSIFRIHGSGSVDIEHLE
jgi:hypothetical protein